jgi:hypothetical protein
MHVLGYHMQTIIPDFRGVHLCASADRCSVGWLTATVRIRFKSQASLSAPLPESAIFSAPDPSGAPMWCASAPPACKCSARRHPPSPVVSFRNARCSSHPFHHHRPGPHPLQCFPLFRSNWITMDIQYVFLLLRLPSTSNPTFTRSHYLGPRGASQGYYYRWLTCHLST